MNPKVSGNYLRAHRKQSGLTQREVGLLLGYAHSWQISRHENGLAVPRLPIALAYEVIFHVPASSLFEGARANAARSVEAKLQALERSLKGSKNTSRGIAQKLEWLSQRRTP